MGAATGVTADFTGTAHGPAGSAAVAAALRVGTVKTAGTLATLQVSASEPGLLVIGGPTVRSRTTELAAGTASVRVRLNRHGTALLHRRSRLTAPLTLGFVAAGENGGETKRVALRFRGARRNNFDTKGR
jgi:hypothetical protein